MAVLAGRYSAALKAQDLLGGECTARGGQAVHGNKIRDGREGIFQGDISELK
jgi:hypothetical protein